jgi:hypothetical protein
MVTDKHGQKRNPFQITYHLQVISKELWSRVTPGFSDCLKQLPA